jgi:N-acetylmuramoyl-L-alanine amidase
MPSLLLALALAVSSLATAAVPGGSDHAPPVARAGLPLAGRVIVIDPGHQLGNGRHLAQIDKLVPDGNGNKPCNTTGTATNAGYPEATFAWRVATRIRAQLRRLGAKVLMTRTSNSASAWGPCVDQRGRRGNKAHADLKLSIHGDGTFARGAHGFHVIYAPDRGRTADTYAASRRYALATRTAMERAGFSPATYVAGGTGLDVRSDLGTLNLSNMATVMVECGNMRDRGDAARMTSARGQAAYAKALVTGIRTYLAAR